MAIKRPKPEEIVVKLRQVEVLMRQGMPRIDAIRQISVTEQTYYRLLSAMQRIACRAMGRRSTAEWAQSNSRN
jgi:hypothetical protein